MATRRSHTKSRRGCLNCKKRRIKCDEQIPSCFACSARGDLCRYGVPASKKTSGGNPQAPVAKAAHSQSEDSASDHAASASSGSRSNVAAPTSTGSTAIGSSGPKEEHPRHHFHGFDRERLELQLMHHWSTSTYASLVDVPEEKHVMQVLVPRDALRFPWLLHGLFALTALHLALDRPRSGSPAEVASDSVRENVDGDAGDDDALSARFLAAALEYYNLGSAGFRAQLQGGDGAITRENYHAMLIFTMLAGAVMLALPGSSSSSSSSSSSRSGSGASTTPMLDRMRTLWDMLAGTATVSRASPESLHFLTAGPLPVWRTLAQPVSRARIAPAASAALARLRHLNARLHGDRDDDDGAAAERGAIYAAALEQLEGVFARRAEGSIAFVWSLWPTTAGRGFARVFREGEPLALLAVATFATLLQDRATMRGGAGTAGGEDDGGGAGEEEKARRKNAAALQALREAREAADAGRGGPEAQWRARVLAHVSTTMAEEEEEEEEEEEGKSGEQESSPEQEPVVWWLRGVAQGVVRELGDLVLAAVGQQPGVEMDDWVEAVAWARGEVGLLGVGGELLRT